MAFEVASVKPSEAPNRPNFPLNFGNAVIPGGRLSMSSPLLTYIMFAYKLHPTENQHQAITARLPKWVGTDFFEIEARAGNAIRPRTKCV